MIFNNYSRYYDLLYRDKDYGAEAAFIAGLIRLHAPHTKRVLELGCGTGVHAQHLAGLDYDVHGVDMSADMLARAEDRKSRLPAELASRLAFTHGDIRDVRIGERFDCILSLFHVMSYQTGNVDLQAAFVTAAEHLAPGGAFIFDCWYGPAVLADQPVLRVKRMQDEAIAVTRIAEPAMHPEAATVDVHYTVFIRDKASGAIEEVEETHHMRYLFQPEIGLFAKNAGLHVVQVCEWLTGKVPGNDTWGVCFVVKA